MQLTLIQSLGFLAAFQRDAPRAFVRLHRTHGRTVSLRLPRFKLTSITGAGDIRRVVKENYKNYSKGEQGADMDPLWGASNVLLSHGDEWARQRRVCGPAFRPAREEEYQATIVRHTDELVRSLASAARSGEVRRLYHDVRGLVMAILCEDWFGLDPQASDQFGSLLARATDIAAERLLVLLKLPLWVPTAKHRRYRRIAQELHVLVGELMSRQGRAGSSQLLDLLLQALLAQDGGTMSDVEVRNNIVVFLLAAYEFPSFGWTLYFIARDPAVMRRIQAEVDTVLAGRTPQVADLERLAYVRMCVDEGLRLFTPSPIIARDALAADELATCRVEAGTTVAIPICAIHHDPARWPEPLRFRPERFADPARIEPFSYLPFGAGARECIGARLSRQLKITIVAMLFQQYSFALQPGYEPVPVDKLKPRPSGGVPVRVAKLQRVEA